MIASQDRSATHVVAYVLLSVAAFSVLFPLALMLINSLRTNFEILSTPLGWPEAPNFAVYQQVWVEAKLGRAIFNSCLVAAGTVAIVCLVATPAAWVIARRRVPGWLVISLYFLATTTVPVQMFIFPLYFLFAKLGLINNHFALMFVYAAIYTPFSLFLLRTYIVSIPIELEEAARIDGASMLQIFTRIIFPLTSPGLLTVALIVSLNTWNEFLISITFLQTDVAATATARFYQLSGRYGSDWPQMMATATLIAAPTIFFFVMLQRRFIDGISSGAVKN
jgi:raffinose/stachyose/melibiose transport system permease protein